MSSKAVVILCAQALLAHVAFSQCVRSGGEYTWGLTAPSATVSSCGSQIANGQAIVGGLGIGNVADLSTVIEAVPSNGGGFPVRSSTTIVPNGISVASENVYEGSLNVIGSLPFLSAVAFEGVLPSAGASVVNYGCGNGITAITSEVANAVEATGIGSAGIDSGAIRYGSGLGNPGVVGLHLGHVAGRHCGCGLY